MCGNPHFLFEYVFAVCGCTHFLNFHEREKEKVGCTHGTRREKVKYNKRQIHMQPHVPRGKCSKPIEREKSEKSKETLQRHTHTHLLDRTPAAIHIPAPLALISAKRAAAPPVGAGAAATFLTSSKNPAGGGGGGGGGPPAGGGGTPTAGAPEL